MDGKTANPQYRPADDFSLHPRLPYLHPHSARGHIQTQNSSAAHTFLASLRTTPLADPAHELPEAQITEIPDATDRDLCDMFGDLGKTPIVGVPTSVCSDLSLAPSYLPESPSTVTQRRPNEPGATQWQLAARTTSRIISLGGWTGDLGRFQVIESSHDARNEDMGMSTDDMGSYGGYPDRADLRDMSEMELDSDG